jgi:hypothetical protein
MNITFNYDNERNKVMQIIALEEKLEYIDELYRKSRALLKHDELKNVPQETIDLLEDIKLTMSQICFAGD